MEVRPRLARRLQLAFEDELRQLHHRHGPAPGTYALSMLLRYFMQRHSKHASPPVHKNGCSRLQHLSA